MRISNSALSFTLIKVKPGCENDLKQLLSEDRQETGSLSFFKVIGGYDLAAVTEISLPDTYGPRRFQPHSLGASSFWLFSSDETSISKDIGWIERATLLTLSFLKINVPLNKDPHPQRVYQLAEKIAERLKGSPGDIEIDFSIHFTLGHREIAFLLNTDSFEAVFKTLQVIRTLSSGDSLRCSQDTFYFTDSYTLPLISYENIIDKRAFDQIRGNPDTLFQITCLPGAERDVRSLLPGKSVLGKYDLVGLSQEAQRAGEFIKSVIDLRNNWKGKVGLVDTSSLILNPNMPEHVSSVSLDKSKQVSEAESMMHSLLKPIEEDLALIASAIQHPDSNRSLLVTVNDLLMQLNLSWNDPRFSRSFMILRPAIEYLRMVADEYRKCLERGTSSGAGANTEGDLGVVVENLYFALNQMRFGIDLEVHSVPSRGYLCVTGISQILVAVSNLCQFLYDSLEKSGIGGNWLGFPAFRRTHGYKNMLGEVKSLPDEAIYYPCLPGTNWATISHEISHSCYGRKEMFHKHLRPRITQLLRELVEKNRARDPMGPARYLWDNYIKMVEELFAHWFDFRHFYFGDREFYLWAIWSTWLELPIVQAKTDEYLLRSLAIYSLERMGEIRKCDDRGDAELIKFLSEQLEELLDFLREIVPAISEKIDLSRVPRDEIVDNYVTLYKVIGGLEEDHRNKNLIDILNTGYPEMDNHIEQIWQGIVVEDPIPNPWKLLLGCVAKARNEGVSHRDCPLSFPLALIVSLSGCAFDRRYIEDFSGS